MSENVTQDFYPPLFHVAYFWWFGMAGVGRRLQSILGKLVLSAYFYMRILILTVNNPFVRRRTAWSRLL